MAKTPKIPVTRRALMQRLNRKLRHDGKRIDASRTQQMRDQYGDFHMVDFTRNQLIEWHIKPEEMARELGVLKPYEQIVD